MTSTNDITASLTGLLSCDWFKEVYNVQNPLHRKTGMKASDTFALPYLYNPTQLKILLLCLSPYHIGMLIQRLEKSWIVLTCMRLDWIFYSTENGTHVRITD